jgi:hypothetical protein
LRDHVSHTTYFTQPDWYKLVLSPMVVGQGELPRQPARVGAASG